MIYHKDMTTYLKKTPAIIQFEKIRKGFSLMDSTENIHEYLIELGKDFPKMDARYRTDENKVSGCQSSVWIAKAADNAFYADSDSIMVKGILHILLSIVISQDFELQKSNDLDFQPDVYIQNMLNKIGLTSTLSTFRKTGISSSIAKIKGLL